MKTTLKLTTGNGVNEMLIHSTMSDSLEFDNINYAKLAFEKEVAELKNTYKSVNDVDYSIDRVKESDQVRTRIDKITFDEDGEIEDIETILESDTFIM